MLPQTFVDEMKQLLQDSQTKLEAELAGMPLHTEMGDDEESSQDEAEQDLENQAVRARIEADLKKIQTALAKIESGTYGVDEDGNEISQERLRVIPWADKAI